MKTSLFTAEIANVFDFLPGIIQDGGQVNIGNDVLVSRLNNIDGKCGYGYRLDDQFASIEFGMLFGNAGFFLKRSFKNDEIEKVRYDFFDTEGTFTFTSEEKALDPLYIETIDMDLSCPILNYLYNFLSMEYNKAKEGKAWLSLQVHNVELFLRRLYQTAPLEIKKTMNDSAIQAIYTRINKAELDPVLTWEERQIVFDHYHETLDKILYTKVRAHKLSSSKFFAAKIAENLFNFYDRFTARPASNTKGLLFKWTIGKVIWFFQTVKNNLGYSVALAVYGPFTYYFITMPMNPHAMQAVGKVRSAYLDVRSEIDKMVTNVSDSSANAAPTTQQNEVVVVRHEDSVSTKNAAPEKNGPTPEVLSNILYDSFVVGKAQPLVLKNTGSETYRPSIMNLLLTTDVPAANKQSWSDRMSQFKQMQIAYEENIEFASRNGRLEQLETQYNFPMQIENTWEELERYNEMIFKIRAENPNLSAKMKQFLTNEVNRSQQLQLYLWDRMGRFILDQIYVMLDKDKEQKRNDYYVGRSFVFMQNMTNILSWRYKDLKKPEGYEQIEKLANFYNSSRKEFGGVMKNLAENSNLFKQKDVYDTKEFRSYMKRQWEILYLQNAKAEEASNMGLNMYIWSVRNTAWIVQSIYSAKREEIGLLVKRDVTGLLFSPSELLSRSRVSMLYETLFHNLTLEFTGIREEIMNRLGKDVEAEQRMSVINNLKEFLTDREKLDGLHMADNKKTAGTTL